MAKDHPETNPITIKPETASHRAEQFSWVPLPYCSPPGCPFPIKSFALSARVSPRTIHFRVLDKSPVSGPGRGPLSCNITTLYYVLPSISFPKLPPSLCCSHVKDYVKFKLRCPGTKVFILGTHHAHLILFLILPKLWSCHAIPEPCQVTPIGQSVRCAENVGYRLPHWALKTYSCKLAH